MASTETKNGAPTVDAAFEQIKGFNEQFLGAARQAGTLYLDAYEKAVDQTIETQADFTRQLTSSYTSTARYLLK